MIFVDNVEKVLKPLNTLFSLSKSEIDIEIVPSGLGWINDTNEIM